MQSDTITQIEFSVIPGGISLNWADETARYGKLMKLDVPNEWVEIASFSDEFETLIDETDDYWLFKWGHAGYSIGKGKQSIIVVMKVDEELYGE